MLIVVQFAPRGSYCSGVSRFSFKTNTLLGHRHNNGITGCCVVRWGRILCVLFGWQKIVRRRRCMQKAASWAMKAFIFGAKELANLGFELFWPVDFSFFMCKPAHITMFATWARVDVAAENVPITEQCMSYVTNTMCKVTVVTTWTCSACHVPVAQPCLIATRLLLILLAVSKRASVSCAANTVDLPELTQLGFMHHRCFAEDAAVARRDGV